MPTQYTVTDLTDGDVATGTGVFDQLMRSMAAHLQKEYDAGRITGAKYADTYTALASNTMTQSIQFLLQKDLSAAQVDLTREQENTQINTTALEAERVTTQTNTTLDVERATDLKEAQIAQLEAETQVILERGGFR